MKLSSLLASAFGHVALAVLFYTTNVVDIEHRTAAMNSSRWAPKVEVAALMKSDPPAGVVVAE